MRQSIRLRNENIKKSEVNIQSPHQQWGNVENYATELGDPEMFLSVYDISIVRNVLLEWEKEKEKKNDIDFNNLVLLPKSKLRDDQIDVAEKLATISTAFSVKNNAN